MAEDFCGPFLDHIEAFEKCWDERSFLPETITMSEFDIVVYGSLLCRQFFETNGLWGLLECEWGRMFPEFIAGCDFLDCHRTRTSLEGVLSDVFNKSFVRNDAARVKLISNQKSRDYCEKKSEEIDRNLQLDQFDDRSFSFCKFRCTTWKISPITVSYEISNQYTPPPNYWEEKLRSKN